MKRKLLVAGLAALAFAAIAASTWEGSAVSASGSEFPEDGLYGACNSFPLNSRVEVENLENGKKTSITITKNVENPAIFMTLAPSAALALGMKTGSSARVRVVAPPASSAMAPSSPPASAESNDPDYNPRLLANIKPAPGSGSPAEGDFLSLLGNASKDSEKPLPPVLPPAEAEAKPIPAEAVPDTGAMELAEKEEAPLSMESLPQAGPQANALSLDLSEKSLALPEFETKLNGKDAENSTETAKPGLSDSGFSLPEAGASSLSLDEPGPLPDLVPDPLLEKLAKPEKMAPEVALADSELPVVENAPAPPPEEGGASENELVPPVETAPEAAPATVPEAVPEATPATVPEAVLEATPATVPEAVPETTPATVPEAAPTAVPAAETETKLSLEPTAPRPPEALPSQKAEEHKAETTTKPEAATPLSPRIDKEEALAAIPAGAPALEPKDLTRIEALLKGSCYIQLGLFSSEASMRKAISTFRKDYPLVYEKVETSTLPRFRIFIGPLGRDEGGVTLLRIKAMGYVDAILKQG